MKNRLFLFLILVGFAFADSGSVGTGSGPGVICIGEAYDLKKGRLTYSEEHQEKFLAGRLTEMTTVYKNAKGEVIAERSLDFSGSSTRPKFALTDKRNGYEEGAVWEKGKVNVYNRPKKNAPLEEKRLDVPEPFVIDGGFHPFLKENWTALTSGKRVTFHFVVPSRLDHFRFVAYEDRAKAPVGGKEKVFVAIPQSKVLRMLVEPIVVRYDVASRRMLEYRGLSNIDGPDGKAQKVKLIYREPGL